MKLAQRLTEAPPSLRWHAGRVVTAVLYRRCFGSLGSTSTIVAPRVLKGVDRIHIGAGVAIYPGAWLQVEQGGESLRISDGCYLGHDCHVHADDAITIGRRCVLADGVFIATTDHQRDDRSRSAASGPITIGDDVFVGQRAVILGGVTIGDRATIGAGAVVTRDIPAGAVAVGVPARVIDP